MMNEMRRHSESMPQPHVPVTHDYNRGARKFTQTVGHEKGAIISPAIQRVFKDLVNDNKFKPQNGDKILDIGCGPFLLAMPFIRDGIHVDGVDTSSEMLSIAAETIENAKPKLNGVSSRLLRADKVKLVETMSEVRKNSYQMAMMRTNSSFFK
jgi:ubiquinone/menaquinone biosynthesis C-methylase UbiE